ncbi:hypothetical protein [Lentilactobacillus sp. Marseille-Q4993]|uniref:hypothetical protein n=1 Tax=Lentilactobacillus sp. Marseille-Q4993 TaxID=3039492 RepID=UPI0024BC6439|nr:hypothetical protein [Lentilactobacillus sp. Marseille-Q4993]
MKKEEKLVINWAIVSLVVFLIANWFMTIKGMRLDKPVVMSEAMQVTVTAIVFYAATIVLALIKVRISYYLLAVVIAIYSVGFVGMGVTMFTDSAANPFLKIIMLAIAIFGIVVNVYWVILAFKLRAAIARDHFPKQQK